MAANGIGETYEALWREIRGEFRDFVKKTYPDIGHKHYDHNNRVRFDGQKREMIRVYLAGAICISQRLGAREWYQFLIAKCRPMFTDPRFDITDWNW